MYQIPANQILILAFLLPQNELCENAKKYCATLCFYVYFRELDEETSISSNTVNAPRS